MNRIPNPSRYLSDVDKPISADTSPDPIDPNNEILIIAITIIDLIIILLLLVCCIFLCKQYINNREEMILDEENEVAHKLYIMDLSRRKQTLRASNNVI